MPPLTIPACFEAMAFSLSDRQTKDALRMGLQASVAAAAQFLMMRSLEMPEQFVGILSAVLVVEPSVGNTLVAAQHRFVATLLGCAVGIVSFAIVPNGYGTAVSLAIAMLVMNVLAGFYPQWRYGVVAAVALALGADSEVWQISLDRCLSIGSGVVVGTVVSFVVWPDKSSERARRHVRDALTAICESLSASLDALQSDDGEVRELEAKQRYAREISSARNSVEAVRFADDADIRKHIRNTERLYHAALIIVRVADEMIRSGERDSELIDRINEIGDKVCEAITRISDEDNQINGHLEEIRQQLSKLRDKIPDLPVDKTIAHATHFGLNEMEDSLQAFEG